MHFLTALVRVLDHSQGKIPPVCCSTASVKWLLFCYAPLGIKKDTLGGYFLRTPVQLETSIDILYQSVLDILRVVFYTTDTHDGCTE